MLFCGENTDGLEELGNFLKHRGTLLFPITTGLHTLNPLEDTKNATISRSFDLLPPFTLFSFFGNPGKSFKKEP